MNWQNTGAIIFGAFLFSACAGNFSLEEKKISGVALFDGEFVVSPDGIYTFAHYYEDPKTGRKIIMVGMNHGGDKEYFESVEKILQEADFVIFEGGAASLRPSKEAEQHYSEQQKKDAKLMQEEDFDIAFHPAIRTFFRTAPLYLELALEGDAINHRRPNWYSGDQEFFDNLRRNPEAAKKVDQEIYSRFIKYPIERKKIVIQYAKNALARMEKKTFSRREFGDFFVLLWSDPLMVELMLGTLGTPRDELTFKNFDRLVSEHNPRTVGVKFGAAHIPNQRRLLEKRGYIYKYSLPLRNLAFK